MEPAFNALEYLSKVKERDVRFNLSINSGSGGGSTWPMKGIYIRDPSLDKPKEYAVTVDPVFFKEESVGMSCYLCTQILVPVSFA